MNEYQNLLLASIEQLKHIIQQQTILKNTITQYGIKLMNELRKLPDWKYLMLNCQHHYEEYPNEFFEWCSYEPDPENNNTLLVKKYYSGYVDYTVMTIKLDIPLQDQINSKKENFEKEYNARMHEKYESAMQVLDILSIPKISYDEWIQKQLSNKKEDPASAEPSDKH